MTPASDVRRIMVALDDSVPSQAALDAAASLAESLGAELEGVFVQDLDLLRLAGLPLAREVGLTSASRRDLDSADVERAWRVQAERVKATLDAVALRHRVQTSFRVTRGEVLAELLSAASDVDVLAMGTMGHMEVAGRRVGSTVRGVAAQASCSVLLLRQAAAAVNRIVLLYEDSDAAERALGWAERLAEAQNAGLRVLLTDDGEVRQRVEGMLGPDAQIETIAADELEARLESLDCQLLIVSHDSRLLGHGNGLLTRLGMPVLVAR